MPNSTSSPEQLAAQGIVALRELTMELLAALSTLTGTGILQADEVEAVSRHQAALIDWFNALACAPVSTQLGLISGKLDRLGQELRRVRGHLEDVERSRQAEAETAGKLEAMNAAVDSCDVELAEALHVEFRSSVAKQRALLASSRERRTAFPPHRPGRLMLGRTLRRRFARGRTPRRTGHSTSAAVPTSAGDGPPPPEPPGLAAGAIGEKEQPLRPEWARLPEIVGIDDVAPLLGCNRKTLYALAHRDELPGRFWLGRRLRILRDVLYAEIFDRGWAPPGRRGPGGRS